MPCVPVLKVTLAAVFVLAAGCASMSANPTKEEADQHVSEKTEAAITRGDQAWRDGDLDRALLEYVTALGFDGANVEALYKVASIHSAKGNHQKAEQAFRQVLAQKQGDARVLEGLGLVLLKQQRQEQAQAILAKAVALEPRLWRAQNGLGVIYDLKGDHRRAQHHYQAARQERPDSPLVLNNLGYSNYLSHNWVPAQRYFEQALTKDPKNQNAWSNLGLIHVRQDRYEEAAQAFQQIMDASQAANTIGHLCMVDGKYDDAERFFSEAIRLSPSYYSAAHTNLAKVQARNRKGGVHRAVETNRLSRWAIE